MDSAMRSTFVASAPSLSRESKSSPKQRWAKSVTISARKGLDVHRFEYPLIVDGPMRFSWSFEVVAKDIDFWCEACFPGAGAARPWPNK